MKSIPTLSFVLASICSLQAEQPSPTPQEFRHQTMSGKDMAGADFGESKFFRVRLNGASFKDAILVGTTFQQSDLAKCDFRGATFGPETKFRECTLNDANLENANLEGADFSRVNLRGARLVGTKGWGNLSDSTLSEADIRGADFSTAKGEMSTVQWSGAIYDDATKFPDGLTGEQLGATKAGS
jgi:uncharacterized protein YjbI with pentapeptide repeats